MSDLDSVLEDLDGLKVRLPDGNTLMFDYPTGDTAALLQRFLLDWIEDMKERPERQDDNWAERAAPLVAATIRGDVTAPQAEQLIRQRLTLVGTEKVLLELSGLTKKPPDLLT